MVVEGGDLVNIGSSKANFITLVNKNAITPEIGGLPLAIFPESPRDFGKYYSCSFPWIFHLCASMITAVDNMSVNCTNRKFELRTFDLFKTYLKSI